MLAWRVGHLIVAVVVSSEALSQQSLRELESVNQFERALVAVDVIKHRKKVQCVLAIANSSLCQCLAQTLPVDTYVRSYASIASQVKAGPEYEQLSAADKTIVDQCVSERR
jgi:3-methyladenine DNA glycosylase Tag